MITYIALVLILVGVLIAISGPIEFFIRRKIKRWYLGKAIKKAEEDGMYELAEHYSNFIDLDGIDRCSKCNGKMGIDCKLCNGEGWICEPEETTMDEFKSCPFCMKAPNTDSALWMGCMNDDCYVNPYFDTADLPDGISQKEAWNTRKSKEEIVEFVPNCKYCADTGYCEECGCDNE